MILLVQKIEETLAPYLKDEGLFLLGVVDLDANEAFGRYQEWLARGAHASMNYMTQNLDIRKNPEHLLDGAKSLLVFAYSYPKSSLKDSSEGFGRIAAYARLPDYHRLLKRKLEVISSALKQNFSEHSFRGLVDSAPILERSFAAKTSAGFIGKNTCYIHPKLGSFLFLAEVITTLKVESNKRIAIDPQIRSTDGGCGTCKRCQVHCPTQALSIDYQIDARKCISYWTIEHRGPIPKKWWPFLKEYIFGCDICQNVCPYNRRDQQNHKTSKQIFPGEIDLEFLATMDQSQYENYFGGSSLTRAKRSGLMRNALISMYVKQDVRLEAAIKKLITEEDLTVRQTIHQLTDANFDV